MLTTRFKNVGAVATGDWKNGKTIKHLLEHFKQMIN